MHNPQIVRNYANALFETTVLEGTEDKILAQIAVIDQAINSDQAIYIAMISPIITKKDKVKLINAITKKFKIEDTLKRFLLLLVRNSRLALLSYINYAYKIMLDESRNIKTVEVISSKILKAIEKKQLQSQLEEDLKQQVDIKFTEDATIIGGMKVKYDSKLMDFSIAGAIEKINKIAKNVPLASINISL